MTNPLLEADRDHSLVSIQCLRAIAALMVVTFHCFPQLQRMGYAGTEYQSLSAGVDIFFIISGFIMLYSAHRSPGRGSGAFLLNRAIRILPPYWILTTFLVLIALFAPRLLTSTVFNAEHVIKSYLMLPAIHPVTKIYQPILIPGWTLNCEMFFYVLFALGLAITRDRGVRLMACIVAIILGFVLLPLVMPVSGFMTFYTNSVIVEFAFGLILAQVMIAGHRLPASIALLCLFGGVVLLAANDFVHLPDIRGIFYGIPALLIVIGTLFLRWNPALRAVALLRVLGDASYSIYLTHMMTMAAMGMLWRRLFGMTTPLETAAFIVVSVTISAIGGFLFYRIVEMPVTQMLKTVTRRGPKATQSAA